MSSVASTSTTHHSQHPWRQPPAPLARRESKYRGKQPAWQQAGSVYSSDSEEPPQTLFQRKLAAARKEMPVSTIHMLYVECDDSATRREVLAFVGKVFHPQGMPDPADSAIAGVDATRGRLGIQLRSWADYNKLINLPFIKNGCPRHWHRRGGRPVRIIAGGCGVVELPVVESALREIGEVRDVQYVMYEHYRTGEYTATIILPHNDQLPEGVALRRFNGRVLQIEQIRHDCTPFCPKCLFTSCRRCPHDRRIESERRPDAPNSKDTFSADSILSMDDETAEALLQCVEILAAMPSDTAQSALKNLADLLAHMQPRASAQKDC